MLPELNQFDYFLKLEFKIDHFDLEVLINNLRVIDKIDYLARLDINKIKSKRMSYTDKNWIQGMHQKAKIIATVGPASREKTLINLIEAGADVFRLNFSHGNHLDHQKTIDMVREINTELGTHIALLQDLQGPKIRVNEVENGGVEIIEHQTLIITTENILGSKERVSTSYKSLAQDVKIGDSIIIDDGNLEVKVTSTRRRCLHGSNLRRCFEIQKRN